MKPGKPICNALTIDLEDWYQGLEIPVADWGRFEERLAGSAARLLGLLRQAEVHGTFFVLGWVAEKYPRLVRDIHEAGHEIGTHGFSHSLVYKLTPEVFRAELKRSMDVLRGITGQAVVSHRAPFFSVTRQSLWALEIMAELGIRLDSSVFPVVNYRYGIPDSPIWAHERPAGLRTILEVPVSVWKFWRLNLPVSGGAYFRILPYWLTRLGLRQINRGTHPFVFYLHPWELDPGHPRIPLPRRIAATHYFNLRGTEGRLAHLLKDFRFAPLREVYGAA